MPNMINRMVNFFRKKKPEKKKGENIDKAETKKEAKSETNKRKLTDQEIEKILTDSKIEIIDLAQEMNYLFVKEMNIWLRQEVIDTFKEINADKLSQADFAIIYDNLESTKKLEKYGKRLKTLESEIQLISSRIKYKKFYEDLLKQYESIRLGFVEVNAVHHKMYLCLTGQI